MIVTALSAILVGLGLVNLLSRKTLIGVLMGVHLLCLGATLLFVAVGLSNGMPLEGHAFAIMIALGGMGQLVAGYAAAIRNYYLRSEAGMHGLKELRQ